MGDNNKNEGFGSRIGFILATIGFSVGVGTLWKFPYLCGQYGGGLFLIIYAILMIVIGIPLFSAEVSLGFASKRTPVKAYQELSGKKSWGLVGVFNMLCIIMVIGYTIPVYGWIIHYIYKTALGTFVSMSSGEVANYFGQMTGNYVNVFIMIAINVALTMLVVRNNMQAGIERIAKILLPSLAVIMVIIIIYGFTMPGIGEGLRFFFTIDMSKLSLQTFLAALGQTFFSLGIAMAVALVFGSKQKKGDTNIVKNSTIISTSVIFVAIMAGLMIFPMVYSFGLDVEAGPGLTFIVMPNVFNKIIGGRIIGSFFYIAFFIAAFSSGIAGWEAVIGFLMDQFGFSRRKALWGTLVLVCIVGIPATLSDSLFNMFDLITNNVFLVAGAFFMSIFVGWVWGIDKFAKAAGIENKPKLVAILGFIIRYVSPIIVVIFSLSLFGVI